jgi:hypothetical protein
MAADCIVNACAGGGEEDEQFNWPRRDTHGIGNGGADLS